MQSSTPKLASQEAAELHAAFNKRSVESLTQLHPALWRAHQLGHSQERGLSTGFSVLNRVLPDQGWAGRQCTEILLAQHGIGELRLLMPTLRQLAGSPKPIVFAHPPHWPVPNVLQQFGLQAEQILLVQARHPREQLWALETLIQSNSFAALLAWLPEQNSLLNGSTLRRLQHQSTASAGPSFIFRPTQAEQQASPAPLRLSLKAHGLEQLEVRIVKRKGPPLDQPLILDLPRPDSALETSHTHNQQEQFDALDRPLPFAQRSVSAN